MNHDITRGRTSPCLYIAVAFILQMRHDVKLIKVDFIDAGVFGGNCH